MAKKKKKKSKSVFDDFQRASQPALAEDIWNKICDGLKTASPKLEMGDIGFYHILDETARETPEKEGVKCALEFSVSPGYLARLPFVDPQRAEEWEKSYEAAIALALDRFGGDAEAFKAGWKPVFEKSGLLRIELETKPNFRDDGIAFSAQAVVRDDEGREITSFDMLECKPAMGEHILDDFSEESIGFFTQNLALNAVSEEYQIRTPNRESLDTMFLGIRLDTVFNSEWLAQGAPMWREGLLMFFDPQNPYNIRGRFKEQVEAIVGTMEKPVFPQQKAIFVLAAKPLDIAEDEWEITVSGPMAYRQERFEDYRAWLQIGIEKTEDPVFSEKLDLRKLKTEDDESETRSVIREGQELARRLLESLGAICDDGEDE